MTWAHEGSRHDRGYGYRWVKLRDAIMARDGYLCQPCQRTGRATPATEVDHITPKSRDGEDDADNLQAICSPCHSAKTKGENANARPLIGADGWPV
ncbi:MAG: HNH endonuclease [Rhodobacteraceae bacterium]|nr:HNH endonuclease [Paracoccaceae bacterium]